MPRIHRLTLVPIACIVSTALAFADPSGPPRLVTVATYDTGLGASGAEVISVRHTDGIAALTNIAGRVDVLDVSDASQPTLLRRVAIDTTAGTPNSVAVHPQHDYFLVAIGKAGATGALAVHRLSDGAWLGSAPLGIQPRFDRDCAQRTLGACGQRGRRVGPAR